MNNILIVDDREDFIKEFKAEAKSYNINVLSRTNLKDMIEFLEKHSNKLTMIVLDIKCLKYPDQEIEHENFLTAALMFLDKEYPYIPRSILTADKVSYDEVDRYHPDEKIFRKLEEDILNLFNYVKEVGDSLPLLKLKHDYADVFEIFSKQYLDYKVEKELINLLTNIDSNESTQIKNNLVTIRRLQEKMFQTLNKSNKNIVPDNCLSINGNVKFRNVDKHLKGYKSHDNGYQSVGTDYYSGVIEELSPMIYNISSSTSAHNPYNTVEFPPSSYTVKSCTFALLNFLIWFKKKMDEAHNLQTIS